MKRQGGRRHASWRRRMIVRRVRSSGKAGRWRQRARVPFRVESVPCEALDGRLANVQLTKKTAGYASILVLSHRPERRRFGSSANHTHTHTMLYSRPTLQLIVSFSLFHVFVYNRPNDFLTRFNTTKPSLRGSC